MTQSKRIQFLICATIFILFFGIYQRIYKEVPIRYWDEQAWIGRTYFFDFFIRGDFNNSLWQTFYSYNQPMLGIYMYGATLYPEYLSYRHRYPDSDYIHFLLDHNFNESPAFPGLVYKKHPEFIDWGLSPRLVFDVSEDKLLELFGSGIESTIRLIYHARFINTIVLAAAVSIIYLLSSLVADRVTAILTGFTVGINFLFITAGIRAHSEGLFMLMFYSTLCVLLIIFKKNTFSYRQAVLLGGLLGLCFQTKINGVMLFPLPVLLTLGAAMRDIYKKKNYEKIFHKLKFLAVVIGVFIMGVILLHPYVYPDPIKNTLKQYSYKQLQTEEQRSQFAHQKLPSMYSRLHKTFRHFIFGPEEHCHYNGIYFLNKKNCSTNPMFYIKMALFTYGFGVFAYRAMKETIRGMRLFLISFIFIIAVTASYLVLDWDRYYVHLIFFFVFFQIYGFTSILKNTPELYQSLIRAVFKA